jgi:hypothetical protein
VQCPVSARPLADITVLCPDFPRPCLGLAEPYYRYSAAPLAVRPICPPYRGSVRRASIGAGYRPTSVYGFWLGQPVAFLEHLGRPLGMSVAVVADRGTEPVATRPRFVRVRAGRASGESDVDSEVGLLRASGPARSHDGGQARR